MSRRPGWSAPLDQVDIAPVSHAKHRGHGDRVSQSRFWLGDDPGSGAVVHRPRCRPPTPSLGRLLQQGQVAFEPNWYQFVLPASVLAILVLAFAFIGDGVRDALDPRMQGR